MKFRKYEGEIQDCKWGCIGGSLGSVLLSLWLSIRIDDYRCLFLGLILAALIVGISCLALLGLIHVSGASIYDTISFDDEGTKLHSKKGKSNSIIWENISKIEVVRMKDTHPMVKITDIYGEKIWWYSNRREHLDYILEKRPELKNVVVTRKGA